MTYFTVQKKEAYFYFSSPPFSSIIHWWIDKKSSLFFLPVVLPFKFIASFLISSSTWLNHLVQGLPTGLFTLNFSSNSTLNTSISSITFTWSHHCNLAIFTFRILYSYYTGVPGGKVSILGGNGIGHSKQNSVHYIYMSPISNRFRDRAISRYSSKIVDKEEILRTVSNTDIYCSSDSVGTLYLVFHCQHKRSLHLVLGHGVLLV
jgi:hypothetical protein